MNQAKVINMNHYQYESCISCIEEYFVYRKKESPQTYSNYKLWIEDFFNVTLDMPTEGVTWKDLESIDAYHIRMFVEHLKSKENAPRTINSKKSAIKNFFMKMRVYNQNVNVDIFNGEKEKVTGLQENSWDSLTNDEMKDLLEYTKNYKTKAKTGIIHLFFKTLYITGVRHHVLEKLKPEDLKLKIDKSTGNKVHALVAHDKTDDKVVAINEGLYNELIEMADDKKVFPVNLHTIRKALKSFCTEYDITDRRIVLHSIRKASGDYVYKTTNGNLEKTSEHLGHKNINTTNEWYIGRNNQLESQASFYMFDKLHTTYTIDMLKDCSKEELLELIDKAKVIRELVQIKKGD